MASDVDANVVRVGVSYILILGRVELNGNGIRTVARSGGEDEEDAIAVARDGEGEFGGEGGGGVGEDERLGAAEEAGGGGGGVGEAHVRGGVVVGDNVGVAEEVDAVRVKIGGLRGGIRRLAEEDEGTEDEEGECNHAATFSRWDNDSLFVSVSLSNPYSSRHVSVFGFNSSKHSLLLFLPTPPPLNPPFFLVSFHHFFYSWCMVSQKIKLCFMPIFVFKNTLFYLLI